MNGSGTEFASLKQYGTAAESVHIVYGGINLCRCIGAVGRCSPCSAHIVHTAVNLGNVGLAGMRSAFHLQAEPVLHILRQVPDGNLSLSCIQHLIYGPACSLILRVKQSHLIGTVNLCPVKRCCLIICIHIVNRGFVQHTCKAAYRIHCINHKAGNRAFCCLRLRHMIGCFKFIFACLAYDCLLNPKLYVNAVIRL